MPVHTSTMWTPRPRRNCGSRPPGSIVTHSSWYFTGTVGVSGTYMEGAFVAVREPVRTTRYPSALIRTGPIGGGTGRNSVYVSPNVSDSGSVGCG